MADEDVTPEVEGHAEPDTGGGEGVESELPVGVDDVKIRYSAPRPAEHYAPIVGRERRGSDGVDRHIEPFSYFPAGNIQKVKNVLAFSLRGERQSFAVVRECALGVEQSQLLEIRIERAFDAVSYTHLTLPTIYSV